MLFGARFPKQSAGRNVQRVDVASEIAEVDGFVIEQGCDADSRGRGVSPVDASGARIERIDGPVRIAHEDSAAVNRRIAERGGDARKSEGPFQFQLGRIVAGEAGGTRGLEASVGGIGPAVPGGTGGQKRSRRASGGRRY